MKNTKIKMIISYICFTQMLKCLDNDLYLRKKKYNFFVILLFLFFFHYTKNFLLTDTRLKLKA